MKHDAVRRWISTVVVWLCGLSVLVALVPLAFIGRGAVDSCIALRTARAASATWGR